MRKPHEEYVKELKDKNPTVEAVEKYNGANTKILHRCLIHNVCWSTTPSRALRGVGCSICHIERHRATRCKTTEQYSEQVHKISPHIDVIGEYINPRTSILHRCNLHNIDWSAFPEGILKGCGCKECGNVKIGLKNSKPYDMYIQQLKTTHPSIICIGKYKNATTPVWHKCLIDNYIWLAKPSELVSSRPRGCPKCGGNLQKTHAQYIDELEIINPNIDVVETYVNARTPIKHRCKRDGYEWNARPYAILSGSGCPKCRESHGEREISLWLDSNNIKYTCQKVFSGCSDEAPLPFDFYLEEFNTAIEYDGEQHYRPIEWFGGSEAFDKRIKHDNIKTQYCEDNNIKLLRIPYYTESVSEELNNFLFI